MLILDVIEMWILDFGFLILDHTEVWLESAVPIRLSVCRAQLLSVVNATVSLQN
jgi:hypothetical protein